MLSHPKLVLSVAGGPLVNKEADHLAVPDGVFHIWNNRWKIEIEAAHLFSNLAKDLFTYAGPDDPIGKMAERAASDELRHAERCKQILSQSPIPLKELTPHIYTQLGPVTDSVHERILYTSVAVCCVTETLSTALLIDMQKKAEPGLISNTIREILVDEVKHSQIGWAQLARSSKETNVSWLTQYIPSMINEALRTDIRPMIGISNKQTDLSRWGILLAHRANTIMQDTIANVIQPGLKEFGIQVLV